MSPAAEHAAWYLAGVISGVVLYHLGMFAYIMIGELRYRRSQMRR